MSDEVDSIREQYMFQETERPGELFPLDTHQIIFSRYRFASQFVRNKRVLEVGCGSGYGVELFKNIASFYVAGEYSDQNIAYIQRKYEEKVVKIDAHHLPFAANTFETVVALAMIYYLDLSCFAEEACRVLAANGVLFFCTSNKDIPGFVKSPYTTRYYSIPELKDVLSQQGFEVEFYGAFPAAGSNYFVRKARAMVKTVCKKIIRVLPYGKKLWQYFRKSSQGELYPLPDKIPEMVVNIEKLPDDKVDKNYRIIYVKCIKRG
ncbi:MAG: class I SAM-dependent methyltransferase [Gammaproteobacteria bacterium]|jgi:SAM-dependent methyltransferase